MSNVEQEVLGRLAREREIAARIAAAGHDPTAVIEALRDLPDLLDFPRFGRALAAAYEGAIRPDDAVGLNEARVEQARRRGWKREHTDASLALAKAHTTRGEPAEALAAILAGLEVVHAPGLLGELASLVHTAGDTEEAVLLARRGVAWARTAGPRSMLWSTLVMLGLGLRETGDHCGAAEVFGEAASIARGEGNAGDAAYAEAERALAVAVGGDLRLALVLVRRAITSAAGAEDPRAEAEGNRVLGTILRISGEPSEAREALKSALRIASHMGNRIIRAKVYEQFALLDQDEGNLDLARAHADHAATDFFWGLAPHFAEQVWRRFVEIGGESGEAARRRLPGHVAMVNGIRAVVRDPGKVVAVFDAAPNWLEDFPLLGIELILALGRLGRFEEAIATAHAMRRHPVLGASPTLRAQIAQTLTDTYIEMGDTDGLLRSLGEIADADRQVGWSLELTEYIRGALAFLQGDFADAISRMRQLFILTVPWYFALTHLRLAVCHREEGRYREADSHLQSAIDVYRRDQREALTCTARAERALVYCRMGDLRMARVLALRAIEAARTYGIVQAEWYARRALGETALAAGDLPLAGTELRAALAGARGAHMALLEAEVLEAVAQLEMRAGDVEAAEATLGGAVRIYEGIGSPIRADRALSNFALRIG